MTSIELRVRSIYDSLSNAEKKVADYFLCNLESVFNKPIATLAQEAGVSKVAWVRFCKDIGFEGLKDLKKAIDEKRKEIKKIYMRPYEIVDAQTKELIALINEPLTAIDDYLNAAKEAEKEQKRKERLEKKAAEAEKL